MKTVTDNVIDIERTIEDALEANSVVSVEIEHNVVEVKIANPRAFVRLFPKREMWKVTKDECTYPTYWITVTNAPYVYDVRIGSRSDFEQFCSVFEYEYVEETPDEEEIPDEVENAETL